MNKIKNINKMMFDELKSRSFLGQMYCKYLLYPVITKYLSGYLIDYGAGIGNYSLYYKKKKGSVISAEVNMKCIQYMNSIGLNTIEIINNRLDVNHSLFDCAMVDNVLEHVRNPTEILKEVSRVVKPNKNIIIGVPGIKGFNVDWDHKIFIDEIEIKKLSEKLNLKITKFFYMPLFKSDYLSMYLRQYCVYAVIKNTK